MVGGAGGCVWLKSRACGCAADGRGRQLCGRWLGQVLVVLAVMRRHCVRCVKRTHHCLPTPLGYH